MQSAREFLFQHAGGCHPTQRQDDKDSERNGGFLLSTAEGEVLGQLDYFRYEQFKQMTTIIGLSNWLELARGWLGLQFSRLGASLDKS